MHSPYLTFDSVSYTYPGSPEPVLEDVSFSIGPGWTAIAGANGSGKTTLLKLAAGLLEPDRGSVQRSGGAVYCRQRTDHPPEGFRRFVGSWFFPSLMARLGVEWDWPERWDTLSHGERKRAQLAMALSGSPDVLALDEPVNHLDGSARELVRNALEGFEGIGLLVSHDRELMDSLAERCGLLQPEGLTLVRGGYSVARREDRREQEALRRGRRQAREKYRQLKRDARRKQLTARTLQAWSSGRKISYREICLTGADGPMRIDGSVQKAGRLSRTAVARAERAREEMEGLTFRKSYSTGISMRGEASSRNSLVEIPEGSLQMGEHLLEHPRLTVAPGDRIALTGPNGSGKSTLTEKLAAAMDLPPGRLLYIPQELSGEASARALDEARGLGPDTLGLVMSCVRRLGSDPEPLLGSALPSPGETRKLLLCLGLLQNPWLVMMDEPTNHLDLPGIECLEEALSGLPCALLLVSHDRRFLRNTTSQEWRITGTEKGGRLEIIS